MIQIFSRWMSTKWNFVKLKLIRLNLMALPHRTSRPERYILSFNRNNQKHFEIVWLSSDKRTHGDNKEILQISEL